MLNISDNFKSFIKKMIELNSKDRFQNIEEIEKNFISGKKPKVIKSKIKEEIVTTEFFNENEEVEESKKLKYIDTRRNAVPLKLSAFDYFTPIPKKTNKLLLLLIIITILIAGYFIPKFKLKWYPSNDINKNIKLIWQKSGSTDKVSWSDAQKYCKNFSLDKYNDWRLPTIYELDSLAKTRNNLKVNVKEGKYWSSSNYKNNPDTSLCIDFKDGERYWSKKSYNGYVLCVRNG